MSLSFGAKVFEKHFLPNSKIKNVGDYKLSLNPIEMKDYIYTINKCFKALGHKRFRPFKAERPFYKSLRRSIYFRHNLKKGHILSKNDLIFLRPYSKTSIRNLNYKNLIGKKVKEQVSKEQLVVKKLIKYWKLGAFISKRIII